MLQKKDFKKSFGIFWSNFKGKSQGVLQKLSRAFMLPIALLPIAGLFLGIGATIASDAVTAAGGLKTFGIFLKMIGEVPFANLPVLFAISVAIAFTDDAGVAGLTALVGFLIFVAVIAVFMQEATVEYKYLLRYSEGTEKKQIIISINELLKGDALAGRLTTELQKLLSKEITVTNDFYSVEPIGKIANTYSLWFWKSVDNKLTTSVLGIGPTLNSGVFGGIIIGAVVAFLYNRFYTTQLPSYISFFSGVKFVPIVVFFAVIPVSFIFILIWPPVGQAFNWFGTSSGKLPVGLDSLFFGIIERSLIPFGLHHVFYAPLWWTGAGGSLNEFVTITDVNDPLTLAALGDQTGILAVIADGKLLLQDIWDKGLRLGRFQSGKFPFMMFGLPAAAAAMTLTVPKGNRRAALGIYASAGLTSFLTGITEPLEFSFLFVAPWLFYAIHVPLAGISFMLMNVLKVKVGMTFSGGFFDWIIYGIVPSASGHATRWWMIPIVGIGYAAVYFTLFYFLIMKFNIKIPGRDQGDGTEGNFRLYTKKDYQAAKNQGNSAVPSANASKNASDDKPQAILDALGGANNIKSIDACASRLRVQVLDNKLVDVEKLKSLGAAGVMVKEQSIQAVFGGQSDIWKSKIRQILKAKDINK